MTGAAIPLPALIMLVGPSGAGKSHWASRHFLPGEVLSSDRLRASVGRGEHDQEASADAFELLEAMVRKRLARGLTVVVDTLGLDPELRAGMRDAARAAGMKAVAVTFDTPADVCRERNRQRSTPVPARALSSQVRRYRAQRQLLGEEGWDQVVAVEDVAAVAERPAAALRAAVHSGGTGMTAGLVISSFPWRDADIGSRLQEVMATAKSAGFTSIWVMDHLVQIPQVGRRWEPMLEAPTTLAWLAAHTEGMEIGTLVANSSLRNPAHLAKIIATIDVLSGGRAICGLGAGWWGVEMEAYGMPLPSARARLDRLEDSLRLLPLMWGPGVVDFTGKTITVQGAECYPRPLRDPLPLVVGGQGERTLRLASRYANGVNLRGDSDRVDEALKTLDRHLEEAGRSRGDLEISHLSWPLVGRNRRETAALSERYPRGDPHTADELLGRGLILGESGIRRLLFAPADLAEGAAAVERLGPVVAGLR